MSASSTPDRRVEATASLVEAWSSPPRPTARPLTVVRHGSVVALRERSVVAQGALRDRAAVVGGGRLVIAADERAEEWWIAGRSVWNDADAGGYPEHPLPIGLATAPTREAAVVAGLSDRLGWEAVLEFERGADLPPARALVDAWDHVVVLDGRLGHEVPTVVVLGRDMVRWAAGATWPGAMRRAMYGDDGNLEIGRELVDIGAMLARSGLGVAAVDLDTPLLRRTGVARCSVQIVTRGPR